MGNFVAAKLCLALILMTFVSQPALAQSVDVNIRIGTSLVEATSPPRIRYQAGRLPGRFYIYRARLGIRRFEVALNSRDRVVDMRPIRR
ncbi:hypothetical protein [Rhizobium sp. 007]|uniref:hypothetical protein n=1 Tax=Rhizobium sp. 007 TaxID=2785056 RepID=UPI00188F5E27|nr:hypothetical protein [Rhizobium sp. 007]QPB21724.1 hypothetical protein ISN39_09965 [Rhizobium sp. 007]